MAHILLLEPDALIAGSIKSYFANAEHSVTVHSDPQSAVSSADAKRPNLVITELQLAARSGVEFLYEFRSYPDWQDIPVIIYTDLLRQQVELYNESLTELNVKACLHKNTSGLAVLLNSAQQLFVHAKV